MEKTETTRWFVEIHTGYGKNETVGETGPYASLAEATRYAEDDDLIFSSKGDRLTYSEAAVEVAS